MQLKWIKVGLGGLIALIFALVNVSAMQSVQARTLKDGTTHLPKPYMFALTNFTIILQYIFD